MQSIGHGEPCPLECQIGTERREKCTTIKSGLTQRP